MEYGRLWTVLHKISASRGLILSVCAIVSATISPAVEAGAQASCVQPSVAHNPNTAFDSHVGGWQVHVASDFDCRSGVRVELNASRVDPGNGTSADRPRGQAPASSVVSVP